MNGNKARVNMSYSRRLRVASAYESSQYDETMEIDTFTLNFYQNAMILITTTKYRLVYNEPRLVILKAQISSRNRLLRANHASGIEEKKERRRKLR